MSTIQHDPYKPKTIKVPCMKCGAPAKVEVPYDFKGTIRKFCPLCMAHINRTETYFDSNYSEGCRHKSSRR